jgi:hypothetical protein
VLKKQLTRLVLGLFYTTLCLLYWPSQALTKNPNNTKAKFRKGKALGEMGYVEKALDVLEDLLKNDDGSGRLHFP